MMNMIAMRLARRRNYGNQNRNNDYPSSITSVHARERDSKGAPRRGRVEYSRPGKSSSGLRDRFTVEEPLRVYQRAKRNQEGSSHRFITGHCRATAASLNLILDNIIQ